MTLSFVTLTPALLRSVYDQEIHAVQARFFGVEGIPKLGPVENCILGRDKGRIKWVSTSNPGESLGADGPAPSTEMGQGVRQFTLIDTFALSAMEFEARRPPNIVVAAGRERGFVRALLCSYDADSNRFSKESVLRMAATVLDRMPKMDEFKFTLISPVEATTV